MKNLERILALNWFILTPLGNCTVLALCHLKVRHHVRRALEDMFNVGV